MLAVAVRGARKLHAIEERWRRDQYEMSFIKMREQVGRKRGVRGRCTFGGKVQ